MPPPPRRTNSPKRIAAAIALWLLIGAVLNIAITWSLAIYPRAMRWDMNAQYVAVTTWPHACPADWPRPYWNAVGHTWSETWYRVVAEEHPIEDANGFLPDVWFPPPDWRIGPRLHGTLIGFPFRSLAHWSATDDRPKPEYVRHDGSLPITLPFRGQCSLPYSPLWPGFIANTILYTLIAFTLIRAALFLRRLRARKGHCHICNYDLTGLPPNSPCPECGTASLCSLQ